MNTDGDQLPLGKLARITGGFYLAYVLASVLAGVLGNIGLGTVPQISQAIITDPASFRLGLVIALISGCLFLVVAWGLYIILRPVSRDLALLFLALNAVGVAIQGAAFLSLVSALLQTDAASHMQAYSAAQLEGLAYLSIGVYKAGWVTAQLFFGTWLFPLGYLVYKSGLLPRFLGVLLVLDGIAVMIWFLQAPAPAGLPRDPLPRTRRELRRRSRAWALAPVQGSEGRRTPARDARGSSSCRLRGQRGLEHEGSRLYAVRSAGGSAARGNARTRFPGRTRSVSASWQPP